MVQTDVDGHLDGTYPVFMGRSKLVSREQFRVPGGHDSISSPELSDTPSCSDEDARAAAAVQGSSGTVFKSDQEVGLSKENSSQPTTIGSSVHHVAMCTLKAVCLPRLPRRRRDASNTQGALHLRHRHRIQRSSSMKPLKSLFMRNQQLHMSLVLYF